MARTLAEAQEEYTAVRAAYLKALHSESISVSSGAGSVSVTRSRTAELKKQVDALANEIDAFENGGISVYAITPVG